ncbi:hypothetical protein [Bosea sp. (in: a-proteobacteria)]|uniref:hypothetical protein n=1 Tax=Bosea sp. (in: a-proteobacteria) TaxID=1871050 RepID=UPI002B46CA49|nr:hypothetical protein [Bosea sp. (in: a-proteobacteria)]WRH59173.1 MAG: hypothetical protein RSE11_05130 [Bosea sp. (in: a-proteobacteria)]
MSLNDNTPPARSPAEHRAAVAAWASTAPEYDGPIFGRTARAVRPKLEHLAEALAPLMTWRRLRETSEAGDVASNWMASADLLGPDNDNAEGGPSQERAFSEESAEALLARLGEYEAADLPERVLILGEVVLRSRRVITGPADVIARYDPPDDDAHDTVLNADGPLRLVGSCAFAGPDHSYPVGTVGIIGRNGFEPFRLTWEYRERSGVAPPPDERCAGADAVDARSELGRLLPLLSYHAVCVLDCALDAANFAAIGAAIGQRGQYARKAGRAALLAACAELAAAEEYLGRKAAA